MEGRISRQAERLGRKLRAGPSRLRILRACFSSFLLFILTRSPSRRAPPLFTMLIASIVSLNAFLATTFLPTLFLPLTPTLHALRVSLAYRGMRKRAAAAGGSAGPAAGWLVDLAGYLIMVSEAHTLTSQSRSLTSSLAARSHSAGEAPSSSPTSHTRLQPPCSPSTPS